MKRTRFSEEQIVTILKQSEAGLKTVEICRQNGISEATSGRPGKSVGVLQLLIKRVLGHVRLQITLSYYCPP